MLLKLLNLLLNLLNLLLNMLLKGWKVKKGSCTWKKQWPKKIGWLKIIA